MNVQMDALQAVNVSFYMKTCMMQHLLNEVGEEFRKRIEKGYIPRKTTKMEKLTLLNFQIVKTNENNVRLSSKMNLCLRHYI